MSKTENKPDPKAQAAKASQGGRQPEKARFLSVRALKPGFRRGGRAWSDVETVVAAAEFSDAQLAQIEAEPLLVVREVEAPAEAAQE